MDVYARVGLSYDLNVRSQEADLLQAHYFQQVLAAELDDIAASLPSHSADFRNAELAQARWRMQLERREIQALEPEVRKLAAMLRALEADCSSVRHNLAPALKPT
jgi:hypothetical protein